MSSSHLPDHAQVPPPTIEEVSPGVFAYIQLDGSWFLNNAGCIVGPRDALVVDTTGTEKRARAWHAAVRAVTDKPVTALVNTHHHADHTNGNFMFAPGVAMVGHERCREEVRNSPPFRNSPLFPNTDFGDCPPTPPNVTFTERMAMFAGDLRVDLEYVGPAHTTNDVVAWLSEERVLFTGDVVFNGGTPFALMGSIGGWLDALDRLEALGARTIVPGHGPVCGPEVLGEVRAYLLFIQETARKGFEAGTPPLELAFATPLGQFESLTDPERFVPNLHRAYSELRGEPRGTALPLLDLFNEMIAYNGGKPLRCLA